jgi:hypothetical protein
MRKNQIVLIFAAVLLFGCSAPSPGPSDQGSNPSGKTSAPEPTATLSASATDIAAGGSVTLTWNTGNADSVAIDPGVGAVPASGTQTVSPTSTTTYTITAKNSQGAAATKTVTITVTAPPPPPPAPALSAENKGNIDWSIGNHTTAPGQTNCVADYAATEPACITGGGRSCLMARAIDSAKANNCSYAFRLTLITQCHNAHAQQALGSAGQDAVCAYLKTK